MINYLLMRLFASWGRLKPDPQLRLPAGPKSNFDSFQERVAITKLLQNQLKQNGATQSGYMTACTSDTDPYSKADDEAAHRSDANIGNRRDSQDEALVDLGRWG